MELRVWIEGNWENIIGGDSHFLLLWYSLFDHQKRLQSMLQFVPNKMSDLHPIEWVHSGHKM